ncbi:hypothetical protein Afil01_54350 [Actinorhabdospora filicis]|uniref:Uncharacterized protein n=1 Tax=Actinorhabdospora filicis TaxID=1785913 RepID=A0A9W6SQS0_9ACTN|nr:hypothetical protein [Actinorhabdospora filicis]GLZ80628.1 hypothetical protein Afil01_54350 [Actinorhabdospora filicis]
MTESAEAIVVRVARERVLDDLIENHPDELIREVALEVRKGTLTWFDAMNSPTYGAAVDAMAAAGTEAIASIPEPLAEAEETARRMIAEVSAHGEIALRPGWERPT